MEVVGVVGIAAWPGSGFERAATRLADLIQEFPFRRAIGRPDFRPLHLSRASGRSAAVGDSEVTATG